MTRIATDPLAAYARYASQPPPDESDAVKESPFAGASAEQHQRIADRLTRLRPELERLAIDLFDHPELGFEEHESVARITALLRQHGFDAQVGAFGLPTSFVASVGSGGPHFAILAEYDALPGVGHACGHNIIAGIAVGAFLALAPEITEGAGTLSIIGTPAEEGGAGKERIIRAGGFDGVDAAAMVHPSVGDQVSPIYGSGTSGVQRVYVTYTGRAGHAAATPYLGLNALDAVVTAYQSIAQLRQHILPIDRIHGIITHGGDAPNIVPERASAEFLVRSSEIETLKVLTARVVDILQAAALATGTEATIDTETEPPYLPLKPNVSLTKHWARHLEERGRTVPLKAARPTQGGPSTDMGNVSWYIPAIHPALGLGGPFDVPPHSAAFAETTVEPAAFEALADAAISLSSLAADYLADPGLRAAVNAEFEERGGVRRWES